MKTRNLYQIILVLSLLVVILSYRLIREWLVSPNEPVTANKSISWEEAKTLMNNYSDELNTNRLTRLNRVGNDEAIQGFRFSSESLNMLTQNSTEVMFYFGKNGLSGGSSDSIQMIAIGMRNNELLLPQDPSKTENNMIFDKAVPCPPMCPK